MPLHPDFPDSPYAILEPGARWLPDKTGMRMEELPPLVQELRRQVKEWRDQGYAGATDTARSLLNWWFGEEHFQAEADRVEQVLYTKKDRSLGPSSTAHECSPGQRKIAVKVVDIFGNDTMKILELRI